jgi:outer membrane protein, multidrug efflux system
MIKNLSVLLAITAILLTGCNMTPKYTRPEAPVPADWPSGPAYKDTASPPGTPMAADLEWREFFTDQQLRAIIARALENNRDLRVAALNVEKARALYRIQRAEFYPTVETDVDATRQRVWLSSGKTSGMVTLESYGVNLGISSWEIDFFGRIRSLEQRALEEYFATAQARRSAQILLVSEVSNTFLTLAADRENLKLARSTLETQQAAYDVIRRRCEVGIAPELDLRQVQTRVDAARVDVAKFTQMAAQDENALNLLAGSPVPADQLPKTLSVIKPLPDVSAGMSSEVLLSRPDILEAEHSLKAANANIGAARAAFFPRISLTTAFGTASGDLSGLFQPGSHVWSYAPQIVLPIFDARTWSGLKATKVEREIALAQYEKAIQAAFREVADALAKRGTLGDQMAAQQSLVDATGQTYKLSKARYEKGIDIYLNVLDAQRSLYSAQQGLITIRLAKLANQVKMYTVLGGGGNSNSSHETK